MAKFTKLNIGDAVASSGGRVWKKLSAESETEDSIVGTWTYNGTAEDFPGVQGDIYVGSEAQLTSPCCTYTWTSGSSLDIYSGKTLNTNFNVYPCISRTSINLYIYVEAGTNNGSSITMSSLGTFTFYEGVDELYVNPIFKEWLFAHFTKQ